MQWVMQQAKHGTMMGNAMGSIIALVHDEGSSGLGFSICPDTCAVSHRQLSNDDLQPNAKAGSTSWHVRHNSPPMLNDDVHE